MNQSKLSILMHQAKQIYLENFPNETCFERAIFFSWGCSIRDCQYCYMSTQPKQNKKGKPAVRSIESMLAEVILCKKLGWKLGFFSGGTGMYKTDDFAEMLRKICLAYGEKIWLNAGALSKEDLKKFLPYIKGVVGSIETVNNEVHKKVCPSKPVEPYLKMFSEAEKLGLKRAVTIIIGLGETIEDYPELKKIISEYGIEKIHFYGLNPQKGTMFENSLPPPKEYQAEWIARTRIDFPKIDIQFGIWKNRTDRISFLLDAGANSISKFPALKEFGKKSAVEIEVQAKAAGRKLTSTLTKLPIASPNTKIGNSKTSSMPQSYHNPTS